MQNSTNLFWVDLEMTGLGDDQVIVEIASLITDADLNVLAEGPDAAPMTRGCVWLRSARDGNGRDGLP